MGTASFEIATDILRRFVRKIITFSLRVSMKELETKNSYTLTTMSTDN